MIAQLGRAGRDGTVDRITGSQRCTSVATASASGWFTFRTDPTAPPEAVDPTPALIESARSQLTIPDATAETSPPPGTDVPLGLPVWFWTTETDPLSATASIPGLSITATATPSRTIHRIVQDPPTDHPDREAPPPVTLTCTDSRPYRSGVDDPWAESSCSHTFDQPGRATIETTTAWTITWESSVGGAGDLGTTERTTSTELHPTEYRAASS